jgi:GT2 family glycosyltransferase
LESQNFSDFEVLVIENGTKSNSTKNICEKSSIKNLQYFYTAYAGVTYGRSIGNLLAKGEIIIQFDDDITLLEENTLDKLARLFESRNVDVVGFLELKTKEEIDRYYAKMQKNEAKIAKLPLCSNTQVGKINKRYDISTGFTRLIERKVGLYKIQSFRSCFMAYRKEVLNQACNWELRYITVGGKGGIREETDFLVRAKRAGAKIYYTNVGAIWHRVGEREENLTQRTKSFAHYFYYQSAHVYMITKDMMEQNDYFKMFYVLPYQFLLGGRKNKGLARVVFRDKSLKGFIGNGFGFFYGFFFGLFKKRVIMQNAHEYLTHN